MWKRFSLIVALSIPFTPVAFAVGTIADEVDAERAPASSVRDEPRVFDRRVVPDRKEGVLRVSEMSSASLHCDEVNGLKQLPNEDAQRRNEAPARAVPALVAAVPASS